MLSDHKAPPSIWASTSQPGVLNLELGRSEMQAALDLLAQGIIPEASHLCANDW